MGFTFREPPSPQTAPGDYSGCVSTLSSKLLEIEERNNSTNMRHIEFEAGWLLRPPKEYGRRLTEQLQVISSPWEVVSEVFPEVLQGFWLPPQPPSSTCPPRSPVKRHDEGYRGCHHCPVQFTPLLLSVISAKLQQHQQSSPHYGSKRRFGDGEGKVVL
ncbi:unnamed protein product [Pleuronectes platessa]|uniref:Uncharacterized protein n=1 Tax=Pleuronectes platessa TaxID=8262 RepID=A0A9N7VGJ0_PLEPL|nr:unnamed protein product [Pleuronectes platessa]